MGLKTKRNIFQVHFFIWIWSTVAFKELNRDWCTCVIADVAYFIFTKLALIF